MELHRIAVGNTAVQLSDFLRESDLELEDVYSGDKTWSDLKHDAGLALLRAGPQEALLRRAIGRLLHVNDPLRIASYQRLLASEVAPNLEALNVGDRRLLRMLVASVVDKAVTSATSLQEGCALLWAHPQVRVEIAELLEVLATRIDHVQHTLAMHPAVPLLVHARYTRLEILGAFGVGSGARVPPWQSGVYWVDSERADLLAFTLDKTSGQFSPTTRYRDFAISPDLIHWESQSTTRAESETGRRYQEHEQRESSVMLFARLHTDDRAFWFLGPATYVRHRGEQPMAVVWRLRYPLPGDLFAAFAAAVA